VGTSNQGSWLIAFDASATMLPQLGPAVSGRVSPRNDNPLSASNAVAANNEVWTIMGPATRGMTWRRRMAGVPSPDSHAART
jgi:hypothetical protein